MNKEEKILALQLILKDIRGNWGWNLEERVEVALDLATEIAKEDAIFEKMVESINGYIASCENGDNDGRYFRDSFPNGYEGMDELHGLENTYEEKSESFKSIMSCITYPEYIFKDRKEN